MIFSSAPDVVSQWGYWMFFVLSFCEGLPIIGVFVPGQAVAIASGFLARTHVFRLSWVFYTVLSGVIAGDIVAYLLGRKYGMNLLNRYGHYVRLTPGRIARTAALIRQHPGKAIISGRFVGVTRAIIPFLSGAMGLPFSKYIVYNLVAAVTWTVGSIGIGFLFGESIGHLSRRWHSAIYVMMIIIIFIGYRIFLYLERKEPIV